MPQGCCRVCRARARGEGIFFYHSRDQAWEPLAAKYPTAGAAVLVSVLPPPLPAFPFFAGLWLLSVAVLLLLLLWRVSHRHPRPQGFVVVIGLVVFSVVAA